MANKKIIFRADGNSEIGLGHVVRSLALADMLKDDFTCEFATRFTSEFIQKEINKVCSKTHLLPQNDIEHFDYFLELLSVEEIAVLDNYYFDTDYQRKIKEKGCKLVCIDDIHDKQYIADAVINHAPGLTANEFFVSKNTKLYLGLDYAMLRKPFIDFVQKGYSNQAKDYQAFICFGGSDIHNLTLKLLSFLLKQQFIDIFHILISSSYCYKNELNSFVQEYSYKNIIVHCNLAASNLVKVLERCSIAISSASTISYEIITLGIPLIVGYYTDNQREIYNGLTKFEGIIGVGNFLKLEEMQLFSAIDNIRQNKEKKKIIDGLSSQRFIKLFNKL